MQENSVNTEPSPETLTQSEPSSIDQQKPLTQLSTMDTPRQPTPEEILWAASEAKAAQQNSKEQIKEIAREAIQEARINTEKFDKTPPLTPTEQAEQIVKNQLKAFRQMARQLDEHHQTVAVAMLTLMVLPRIESIMD